MFFNYVSHLLFGFFTVHFTSLTFTANAQSANVSLTWTDIVLVNHLRKETFKIEIPPRKILPGATFQTLRLRSSLLCSHSKRTYAQIPIGVVFLKIDQRWFARRHSFSKCSVCQEVADLNAKISFSRSLLLPVMLHSVSGANLMDSIPT